MGCGASTPALTTDEEIHWKRGGRIGSGTFGTVFLGMNQANGELLAVKEVPLDHTSPTILQDLQTEVAILRRLRNKHIVRYIGMNSNEADRCLYIFTEWVPGGSIVSVMDRFGRLSESVVQEYTRQILQGLDFLHSHKVLHRDIKGQNVLVDEKGTIKLADFGAAQELSKLKDVEHGAPPGVRLVGTPQFMAPEVLRGEPAGFSSDIWSVGCTVIQMIQGRPPWLELLSDGPIALILSIAKQPRTPTLPKSISPALRDFLTKALDPHPQCRPAARDLLRHAFITQKQAPFGRGGGAGEWGEPGGGKARRTSASSRTSSAGGGGGGGSGDGGGGGTSASMRSAASSSSSNGSGLSPSPPPRQVGVLGPASSGTASQATSSSGTSPATPSVPHPPRASPPKAPSIDVQDLDPHRAKSKRASVTPQHARGRGVTGWKSSAVGSTSAADAGEGTDAAHSEGTGKDGRAASNKGEGPFANRRPRRWATQEGAEGAGASVHDEQHDEGDDVFVDAAAIAAGAGSKLRKRKSKGLGGDDDDFGDSQQTVKSRFSTWAGPLIPGGRFLASNADRDGADQQANGGGAAGPDGAAHGDAAGTGPGAGDAGHHDEGQYNAPSPMAPNSPHALTPSVRRRASSMRPAKRHEDLREIKNYLRGVARAQRADLMAFLPEDARRSKGWTRRVADRVLTTPMLPRVSSPQSDKKSGPRRSDASGSSNSASGSNSSAATGGSGGSGRAVNTASSASTSAGTGAGATDLTSTSSSAAAGVGARGRNQSNAFIPRASPHARLAALEVEDDGGPGHAYHRNGGGGHARHDALERSTIGHDAAMAGDLLDARSDVMGEGARVHVQPGRRSSPTSGGARGRGDAGAASGFGTGGGAGAGVGAAHAGSSSLRDLRGVLQDSAGRHDPAADTLFSQLTAAGFGEDDATEAGVRRLGTASPNTSLASVPGESRRRIDEVDAWSTRDVEAMMAASASEPAVQHLQQEEHVAAEAHVMRGQPSPSRNPFAKRSNLLTSNTKGGDVVAILQRTGVVVEDVSEKDT